MSTFLQARITATQSAIVEAETAEAAILAGSMASYSIDTGQTKQTVTKFNVTELRNYIDSLYNRLSTLEARLCGSGATIMRPDF